MTIELEIPDSLNLSCLRELRFYLQAQVNRLLVGELRYGPPHRRKKYMKRIGIEYQSYRREGNFEQLINIANYCFLESMQPENRKLHFDPNAASATRDALGGAAEC